MANSNTPRRAYGEGSIDRFHNHPTCPPVVDGVRAAHTCKGSYRARAMVTVAGKRVRKTVYGSTRAEVVTKLKKLHAAEQNGTLLASRDTATVEAWLRTWYAAATPKLKSNTQRAYLSRIDRYLVPHLGKHRLDRLTPQHVTAMYDALRAQGLAEGTLRQCHAVLHRALRVAMRQGKLVVNVADMIDPPTTAQQPRKALTLDEAWAVLRTAGENPRPWVALLCGLRQGEAMGLRWCDVVLDGPDVYLVVNRAMHTRADGTIGYDTPKTRSSARMVPLPTPVAARLAVARAQHLAAGGTDQDRVFLHGYRHNPLKRDYNDWCALLKAAGVDHRPLHAARNTTAHLLEDAGVAPRVVAEILGHTSLVMTYRYQAGNQPAVREAMRALDAHLTDSAKDEQAGAPGNDQEDAA